MEATITTSEGRSMKVAVSKIILISPATHTAFFVHLADEVVYATRVEFTTN